MPGHLLDESSTVSCLHQGMAKPQGPSPGVTIEGQPVIGMSRVYQVSGCSFVSPAPGPCTSAQWLVASTRVKVGGDPVVLSDSTATCLPTATGLMVSLVQSRVKAV